MDEDGEAPPGLSPAPKHQKTASVSRTSEADDGDDVSRDGTDLSSALDERHHESPEGREVAGEIPEVDGGSTAAAMIEQQLS